MEENAESSSKLEWEILDLYGGKQKSNHVISPFYCNNNDNKLDLRISSKASVFPDSLCCPIPLPAASYDFSNTCDDVVMRADDNIIPSAETVSSSSSVVFAGEQLINLGLGRQTRGSGDIISLSPNNCNKTSSITGTNIIINDGGSSLTPSKRSRTSYQHMQNPFCQVEGCNLDLKPAKDYHRRHRICENHSKSPRVVVGGLVRRFCQQCSRFHDLSEFDDKKRSCRKRLSDHNARRRRLQSDPLNLRSSTSLSSALYDQRPQSIVLNGLSISLSSNSNWDQNGTMLRQQTRESSQHFIREGINPNSISNLHVANSGERLCSFQNPRNTRVSDQRACITSRTDSHVAPDLISAHSLLSTNSWSLNDAVSSSINNCNGPSVMNTNIDKDSSGRRQWSISNNADLNIIAADQGGINFSLMYGEGTASSSSSSHLHDQHGNFFLF